MSSCTGFSRPTGGETFYKGDNFTISWAGGLEIFIIPSHTDVCTFRLQLHIPRLQRVETIVDNHNFTFGTSSWYSTNVACSNADTQMSYDWTIPRDLELTNSDLTQCSITFTNLTEDNAPDRSQTQTLNSDLFNIKEATTTTSGTGPTNTITTTTPTPTPVPSLSTGAKAGIGVGVAFVVLCCALGAWIFLKRKKKSKTTIVSDMPAEEQNSGYVKAEMDANEARQRAELDAQQSGTKAAQERDARHRASERDPVELMG